MKAWLGALVLLASPALAEIHVSITNPPAGRPVFGKIELRADVQSDAPVDRVLFFVDGGLVGQAEQAPYSVAVDLGQENADHEFRVVAYDDMGERGSAVSSTAAIAVDERLELRLQQLFVTVQSPDEGTVHLSAEDFRVLDEGAEQKLVTFERGEVPITAVLLLDTSASMQGGRLEGALSGARAFIGGMRELDEAKVVLFSDRLQRSVAFTSNHAELDEVLTSARAVGGTAVNDYLYMALKVLDQEQGRRVVVLFSDGADVHSVLPMAEVVEKARTSQALIYWIHLQTQDAPNGAPSFSSSWRDAKSNEQEFRALERAVERSGGRVELLKGVDEIEPAFAEIISELREQYVLGYYPSSLRGDGSWHEVKVRVRKAGTRVRTRGGYLDN